MGAPIGGGPWGSAHLLVAGSGASVELGDTHRLYRQSHASLMREGSVRSAQLLAQD